MGFISNFATGKSHLEFNCKCIHQAFQSKEVRDQKDHGTK